MAIDASRPYVPAIREAFKDVVRVAVLRTRPPVGEEGVDHAARRDEFQTDPIRGPIA